MLYRKQNANIYVEMFSCVKFSIWLKSFCADSIFFAIFNHYICQRKRRDWMMKRKKLV